MKVCVITIIDYKNYGNRLQNYALNKVLEKLGIKVINGLEFFSKSDWLLEQEKKGKNIFLKKKIPIKVLQIWLSWRKKLSRNNKQYNKRIQKLREFTKNNMATFPYLYVKDKEDLKKKMDDKSIDYYLVGSDQVWNPYYEAYDFEFLTFTDSKKRGSFAASFGVDSIPEIYKKRYATRLREFNNLSVREKSGQKFVKELIGREAHVSLDPTLVLPRNEWEKLIQSQNVMKSEKDYIVTYFLGDVPQCVLQYASEKHIKIYCLNEASMPSLFGVGIEEFLYLIKNAQYVVTDSFHATAFSVIFNTNFYVFNRTQEGVSNMFTRLKTLLELLGLMDRVCENNKFEKVEKISEEKWNSVNQVLDFKRNEEINYLSNLLGIN